MRQLLDPVSHSDRAPVPGEPQLTMEFPDLVANLARRMAEVWLQALTSLAPAAPTPVEQHGDYTAKELGKQLQMSESTIYKHWRAGAWPNAYMISKQKGLRIPRRDVEAWKAAKTPAKPVWNAKGKSNARPIRTAS